MFAFSLLLILYSFGLFKASHVFLDAQSLQLECCVYHQLSLSNFINVIFCPLADCLMAIICGSLQIKLRQ